MFLILYDEYLSLSLSKENFGTELKDNWIKYFYYIIIIGLNHDCY